MSERISELELYIRTSQYGGFHKKLAILIAPYLNEQWDIADIGCGAGAIDFYLAEYVRTITAIDIDPEQIRMLTADIDDALSLRKPSAGKIFPEVADARELSNRMWDMILLCFYAVSEDALAELMGHARKRAILIVHDKMPLEEFIPLRAEAEKCTADILESRLNQLGYRYKKETVELPFGQPFRSIEEIHDYLSRYTEKIQQSTEDRIVKTNRYDYPYYLPRSLNAGVFIVSKN